ncbi:MAG: LysR family transcriptional regulator [Pseudomonadales bacterium]|nr:LysR family transcriptional regulator [Pseudomonadales bacterium]
MKQITGMVIFAKVVECGSFSGAAQQLNLAKSSVSKHLAKLEAELGVRLIQRSTRQFRITEEGKLIYLRARAVVQEMEQAVVDASHFHTHPQGTLTITAPPLFGSTLIAGLIPPFQLLYPALKVNLFLSEDYSDVIAEGYDLSIRLGELADSSLIGQFLYSVDVILVATPAYLKRQGLIDDRSQNTLQHPQQLLQQSCLVWQPRGKGPKNIWHFTQDQQEEVVTVTPQFCCNDWSAIKQVCLAGAGIARISSYAVSQEVSRGELVVLLPQYKMPSFAITGLYPERKHVPVKTTAFLNYLRTAFA